MLIIILVFVSAGLAIHSIKMIQALPSFFAPSSIEKQEKHFLLKFFNFLGTIKIFDSQNWSKSLVLEQKVL